MNRNPLISPAFVGNLLREHRLALNKKRGQNFLIDGNILKKIIRAADLRTEDSVIEIGAGLGTMTLELCQHAGMVMAVEWDRGLIPLLSELTAGCGNLKIVPGDILKIDLADLVRCFSAFGRDGALKVVSNLPYSIAGAVLVKLLESRVGIGEMVCMVQKEVGERIVSPPGGRNYGAFSVIAQMRSRPRLLFKVKKNCFLPPPNVDSVVVRFELLPEGAFPVKDAELWKKVVAAAFSHRRKTLKNALVEDKRLGGTESRITEACFRAGIDPGLRAEQLSVEDFARLANAFLK